MYFDYAATTPPSEEVMETFDRVNRAFWANPHALHPPGMRAEALLEQARKQVLELLGASDNYRCVFTSGTTEANNLALKGVVRHARNRGRHIITSAAEHPSVLEVCRFLGDEECDLTVLPVNASGEVESETLKRTLRPDTVMVSLMHINNEVGAVNDLAALGAVVKSECDALFHVDAAQSVGKFALALDELPVDLLSFSAHKFFGLKGSGALLLRDRIALPPLFHGGGQEAGFRSGTADAASAAALAKALRLAVEKQNDAAKTAEGFKESIAEAFSQIDGTQLNGNLKDASPFIINYSVSGVRPEALLNALAEKEIYMSTVSACSARKTMKSHVVLALTGDHERAQSSIRISLSSQTTQVEVDELCRTLKPVIESLRVKQQ